MRKVFFIILLVCSLALTGCGPDIRGGSDEYVNTMVRGGAIAKFTLKVVDADGVVVPDANAKISYATESSQWIKGTTDADGLFSAKGMSQGTMNYGIEKKGYYATDDTVHIPVSKDVVVIKDGKWQPWNTTITVVLKKVKKPVPMFASFDAFIIPTNGFPVGLDLEKLDWVAPYGKGVSSDIIVLYKGSGVDPWTYHKSLSITFGTNVFDGVQAAKLDKFSQYRSFYEAPTNGYKKTLNYEYESTKTKILTSVEPNDDEYFIFRVRSEVDANGNLLKANYGKIYGGLRYGRDGKLATLRMRCYFNPEINSRNLEFDTKRNLSGRQAYIP